MKIMRRTITIVLAAVLMVTLLTPVTGKAYAAGTGAVPSGTVIVTMKPPAGHTGWVKRGDYYYFYFNGTPLKGWQIIGGKWHILNGTTGALYRVIPQVTFSGANNKQPKGKVIISTAVPPKYTGWIKRGNYFYHYYNGHPMKGIKKIGGVWYNLNGTTGALYRVIGDDMDHKAQRYNSNRSYLVLVSYDAHRVRIYRGQKNNWERVKNFSCTMGARGTRTPRGTYTIKNKGRYFNTGSRGRCWYWTQFYGNYLFHSVIYNRNSSPNHIIDGRLGINASHGCIRLKLKNAKWIYDNVPRRTKVVIY